MTSRTRITRVAERQVVDRQVMYDVLDAGLVAHVGVVRDGGPVVLPLGYARSGDSLLLHGSTGGGPLRSAASGAPLAVTVTLLDGLVYARSLFDSSMNYRSVTVYGIAKVLEGAEKLEGLRGLAEHLMPGRWTEVRPMTTRELAATLVLRLPLAEASVKVRAEGATTASNDGESREVWAGVLPVALSASAPEPDIDNAAHLPVPASVSEAQRRYRSPASSSVPEQRPRLAD